MPGNTCVNKRDGCLDLMWSACRYLVSNILIITVYWIFLCFLSGYYIFYIHRSTPDQWSLVFNLSIFYLVLTTYLEFACLMYHYQLGKVYLKYVFIVFIQLGTSYFLVIMCMYSKCAILINRSRDRKVSHIYPLKYTPSYGKTLVAGVSSSS